MPPRPVPPDLGALDRPPGLHILGSADARVRNHTVEVQTPMRTLLPLLAVSLFSSALTLAAALLVLAPASRAEPAVQTYPALQAQLKPLATYRVELKGPEIWVDLE